MMNRRSRLLLPILLLPGIVSAGDHVSPEWRDALAHYHAARYTQARTAFVVLARDRSNDVEADFYLGRLALWFDDDKTALAHLEKAHRVKPVDARICHALGDAYGLSAQRAPFLTKAKWAIKCRTAYERAVELEPNNTAYRMSLLGYCLVAPRVVGGGLANARDQAKEIAKIDPALGRVAWANLYLAESDFASAFGLFDEVLRENPDDYLALYQIGRCAALSGQQLERGLTALRRCLVLAPPAGEAMPTHASVHHRIGDILEQLGDRHAAQHERATARNLDPDLRLAKMALRH